MEWPFRPRMVASIITTAATKPGGLLNLRF